MNYWMLNLVFLAVVAVITLTAVVRARASGRPALSWRAIAITALIMLALTAVFDNIMIAIGLVGYNSELTNPARLGVAPLEDFAYTVAAVLLLPALWSLGRRS